MSIRWKSTQLAGTGCYAGRLVSRGWISACSTSKRRERGPADRTRRDTSRPVIGSPFDCLANTPSPVSVLMLPGTCWQFSRIDSFRPGRNDWLKYETYFPFFRLCQNFLLSAEPNLLPVPLDIESHWKFTFYSFVLMFVRENVKCKVKFK